MKNRLLLFLLVYYGTLQAQFVVKGKVLDYDNQPVILGIVAVYYNNNLIAAETTDFEGFFELDVQEASSVLSFQYIGLKTVEIPVAGKHYLEVTMKKEETPPGIIGCGRLISSYKRIRKTEKLPRKDLLKVKKTSSRRFSDNGNGILIRSSRMEESLHRYLYFDGKQFVYDYNPIIDQRTVQKLLRKQRKTNKYR